ncbi:efflux RND transporter permease subunit, partial [Brucella ceti]
ESEGHGPLFLRRIGGGLANFYRKTLHACLSAPFIVVLVAVLFAGASYVGYGLIRQELTPSEDRAVALLRINGPQGISVEFLQSQLDKIEEAIQPLRDSGEITTTYAIAGSGGSSNNGFVVLTLAPWKERQRS